jgi:prepilin-type N-terminal cleavage/methylation domain-containing protein
MPLANPPPTIQFMPQRLPRAAGSFSHPEAGFTLLELMVVIILLSILLGFAIPAFQKGGGADSADDAARYLLHAVKKLKTAALNRQQIHKLHLDLGAGRIWVTRGSNASADDPPPPQSEWVLPDDIHIASVRFPDNREIRTGTVVIAFFPQGYSDRAIVRLSDDGNTPTDLIIEAFLPMALIASNHETTAF